MTDKKHIVLRMVDTDKLLPGHNKELPDAGNHILGPELTIDELKARLNEAATTSPSALARRRRNNSDPTLN